MKLCAGLGINIIRGSDSYNRVCFGSGSSIIRAGQFAGLAGNMAHGIGGFGQVYKNRVVIINYGYSGRRYCAFGLWCAGTGLNPSHGYISINTGLPSLYFITLLVGIK
jgi:hypothetical protein